MARKKKNEQPLKDQERDESAHSEESTDLAVQKQLVTEGQLTDTNIEDDQLVERETDTNPVTSAEEAAIHTDTQAAREASGDLPQVKSQKSKVKSSSQKSKSERLTKQRSKRYVAAVATVDARKSYSITKAIELARQTSYAKFDASVELHVRVAPRRHQEAESIRGLLQLPHGTGKATSAVILTEELIDEIAKTSKIPADTLIATPALMPKVAKIAKILGPQGKMPSPKAGTVSDEPEDVLAALQSGRVEYRADKGGNVHQLIGKVSWEKAKLEENARAVLGALGSYQLLSVTLSATMGPGVAVDAGSR